MSNNNTDQMVDMIMRKARMMERYLGWQVPDEGYPIECVGPKSTVVVWSDGTVASGEFSEDDGPWQIRAGSTPKSDA